MRISRLNLVYFSGTGTTRTAMLHVAEGMSFPEVRTFDLSRPDVRGRTLEFGSDELVVLGMPVYTGRIPILFHDYEHLKGDRTPLACVAVYGNRGYDDALLEMKLLGEKNGFHCVAAGAFVVRHCLNHRIAGGRPDAEDLSSRRAFGHRVAEKLIGIEKGAFDNGIEVPGKFPHVTYRAMPFAPDLIGENCIACGKCARECPVQAIDPDSMRTTNARACIFCYRCVSACPRRARGVKGAKRAVFGGILKMVERASRRRRETEVFI